MARFRRKPIPIEAVPLRWDTWGDVCELIGAPGGLKEGNPEGCYVDKDGKETDDSNGRIGLKIPEAGGVTIAVQDDWIVKMPDGEILSFKPVVFETLFESHADYKVEYEPDWGKYRRIATAVGAIEVGAEWEALRDELRALLVEARADAVQYVHDVRTEELVIARADERSKRVLLGVALRQVLIKARVLRADARCTGPELLAAADDFVSAESTGVAADVRSLTDDQLLVALKNVGCDLACGACAGVFFTGSKLGDHTCPKGQ